MNAVTYKEIFPLVKANKLWFGQSIHSGDRKFYVPDNYPLEASGCGVDSDGRRFIRVKGVRWWTNIDTPQRHEDLILYKKYTPEEYPKYDNYDAINVDKTADIPADYNGVMGVPITFLDKYNPDQFEIVAFRKGNDGKDLTFTREREFNHTFESLFNGEVRAHNREETHMLDEWKKYVCSNRNQKIEPVDFFYPSSMSVAGLMNNPKDTTIGNKSKYARILIRRKQNEN